MEEIQYGKLGVKLLLPSILRGRIYQDNYGWESFLLSFLHSPRIQRLIKMIFSHMLASFNTQLMRESWLDSPKSFCFENYIKSQAPSKYYGFLIRPPLRYEQFSSSCQDLCFVS